MKGVIGYAHSGGGWFLKAFKQGPPSGTTKVAFTFNMDKNLGTSVNLPLIGFCKYPVTPESSYYALPGAGVWLTFKTSAGVAPIGFCLAYTTPGHFNPTYYTGSYVDWPGGYLHGVDYDIELIFNWDNETMEVWMDGNLVMSPASFPTANIMSDFLANDYTFAFHASRYNDDATITIDNVLITDE
jgi:hypothetical protein